MYRMYVQYGVKLGCSLSPLQKLPLMGLLICVVMAHILVFAGAMHVVHAFILITSVAQVGSETLGPRFLAAQSHSAE